MRNKFLSVVSIAAISCSSLVSLANDTSQKNSSSNTSQSSSWDSLLPDSYITATIKKNYITDDRINNFNIRVVTINGNVTLTGTVPDEQIKKLAISIAKSTKGVENVDTNLVITEDSLLKKASNDAVITSKIKALFLNDSDINGLDIKVETINNVVSLNGTVPTNAAKLKAIAIAKIVKSVKTVNSNLTVKESNPSDIKITSAIKIKIFGDSELDGLDIHVTTVNREVTLSGAVESESAKARAISIAKGTEGVKKVHSKLTVKK